MSGTCDAGILLGGFFAPAAKKTTSKKPAKPKAVKAKPAAAKTKPKTKTAIRKQKTSGVAMRTRAIRYEGIESADMTSAYRLFSQQRFAAVPCVEMHYKFTARRDAKRTRWESIESGWWVMVERFRTKTGEWEASFTDLPTFRTKREAVAAARKLLNEAKSQTPRGAGLAAVDMAASLEEAAIDDARKARR